MGVADPVGHPEARHGRPAAARLRPPTPWCWPPSAASRRKSASSRSSRRWRSPGATSPTCALLLVGQALPHFDALAAARAARASTDLVTIAGYVDDDELPAYLAASDVVLSLRWPSARETSASWLRAIAAGRPTIVTDLAQQADCRRSTRVPGRWSTRSRHCARLEPVAVSIDILDEQHSLTLALKRLTGRRGASRRLGAAARAHWAARHTVERMAAAYEDMLGEAAALPDPSVTLPCAPAPDAAAHARALVAAFPEATPRRATLTPGD